MSEPFLLPWGQRFMADEKSRRGIVLLVCYCWHLCNYGIMSQCFQGFSVSPTWPFLSPRTKNESQIEDTSEKCPLYDGPQPSRYRLAYRTIQRFTREGGYFNYRDVGQVLYEHAVEVIVSINILLPYTKFLSRQSNTKMYAGTVWIAGQI